MRRRRRCGEEWQMTDKKDMKQLIRSLTNYSNSNEEEDEKNSGGVLEKYEGK